MLSAILAALIAVLHLYILWIEMFRWEHPRTRAAFGGIDADLASKTRALAANQGLYNGFLAAGLAFALMRGDGVWLGFFLACVVVAGLYGAATATRRILFIQALPAALALIALWLGW